MAIILDKTYAECWSCNRLTNLLKLGHQGSSGAEWLCEGCIEEVRGKTKTYYKRKKIFQEITEIIN